MAIGMSSGLVGRAEVREWIVENFKAIDHVSTSLPQLTVLAGANSSGKSSLLQSLLFLAQSDDEDIVLNGTLARLGDPVDVIRDGQVHVALGAVVNARMDDSKTTSSVAFRIELESRDSALSVRNLAVYVNDEPILEATRQRVSATQIADIYPTPSNLSLLRVTELYGKRAPAKTFLGFGGLHPEVFIYWHPFEKDIQFLRKLLRDKSRIQRRAGASVLVDVVTSRLSGNEPEQSSLGALLRAGSKDAATEIVLNWADSARDEALRDLSHTAPNGEWVPIQVARFGFASSRGMRGIYKSSEPGNEKFAQALRSLSVVTDALRTLRTSVRYLGPLRAEPRVVSPTGGNQRSLPVGARGEYTADLLAHDKNRTITFADWNGRTRRETLPAALSIWAQYLGIGDRVAVLDQGKLGRGLRVVVDGVERDLTTIGVGASQVLPVLALVLGTRRGSLILLEQPELHLHPAVQSRLADFFLFARPDVHLMVETHSEYLVTRLRLRVAQSRVPRGKLDVLFAHNDSGVTSMRSLTMDQYGDFDDWPTGFFDTQDHDAREIVAAINKKMRAGNAPAL